MKKIIALMLVCCTMLALFAGCGKNKEIEQAEDGTYVMSFSQAQRVSAMEELDGKNVTIIGYMSTLSPISGQFMYLMNLPYQSCPFCIPNTSELSNTIAVYAQDKKEFEFTDRAIKVNGVLEFGDWTDEFGYEYKYRIKDASYTVLDTADMSEELKLWQQLASTNVIADVYQMYDYVNFVCFWAEYKAQFGPSKDDRDYLYPEDVAQFLAEDSQYGYAASDTYFDDMIARINEVDPNKFSALTKNIKDAEALVDEALAELESGNFEIVKEYSGLFNDGRNQYKLKKYTLIDAKFKNLYGAFSDWLAEWEL